ncbi:hypothetical protein DVB87_10020 [Tsukamurella tyrosinosolvens]|nr:hypothetical protein DVB87_10020 [Tsukamurella tyrosinosolvens]
MLVGFEPVEPDPHALPTREVSAHTAWVSSSSRTRTFRPAIRLSLSAHTCPGSTPWGLLLDAIVVLVFFLAALRFLD